MFKAPRNDLGASDVYAMVSNSAANSVFVLARSMTFESLTKSYETDASSTVLVGASFCAHKLICIADISILYC